jgi:hypothetical protein
MSGFMIIFEDLVKQKNQCFNFTIAEEDMTDLAFNGLSSYIR